MIEIYLRTCDICGKTFEGYHNQKYCCDKCKAAGNEKKRNEWRKRSGYNETQKLKKREERERRYALRREEYQAIQSQRIEENQKKNAARAKRNDAALRKRAEDGEPLARMQLIRKENHGFWYLPEYWDAYQDNMIAYYEKKKNSCNHFVNGVHILEPEFSTLVVESIKEIGVIRTH